MAGKSAVLSVKILVDAAQAAAGLDKAGSDVESFGSKFAKIGAAVAAAAGITAFAAKAVSAASDLQDAMGSVDSVFKDNAKQVHDWASDTSDSIRLPQADFEAYAASIGSMLKNAGTPMDQLAGKTKELMQLSADLSAQSGQTASVGVDAMKAALKGEYEQLENLNVSITAAQVSTEALSLAHGDAAAAADPLIRQQAALNLIYEQSTDAQGAAARESGNYASVQDHLNEVLTNFLAAVGTPLLSGLAGLIDGFTNIVPLVLPLATGVAELVGWVLQLPAPLLAAAAGLAAWQIIGGLSGITTAFAAAIKAVTVAVQGLQAGTIVGAAILGLILMVELFTRDMGPMGKVVGQVNNDFDAWAATLDKTTGAVTDLTRTTVANSLAQQGVLGKVKELGLSTDTYLDAVTGVAGAQEKLAAEARTAAAALFAQGGALDDVGKAAQSAGVPMEDLVNAVVSGDWTSVTGKLGGVRDSFSLAGDAAVAASPEVSEFFANIGSGQDPTSGLSSALKDAGVDAEKFAGKSKEAGLAAEALGGNASAAVDPVAELKKALDDAQKAADQTGGNAGLTQMKTVAEDATRATDLLSLALDKMTGGTRTTDAAVADFNKSITGIGSAFEDTAAKGGINQAALTTWNVAALTATEAGQGIYDALTQVSSAYETSVGAAYASANASGGSAAAMAAAQAEATRAHDAFTAQAGAMHLSADETAQLAAQLGVLDAQSLSPKVFELIAQDQQARDAVIYLQNQGIPAKDFTVTAGVDGALGTVDDLIQYVDKSGATVTVDSTVVPATTAVQGLAAKTDAVTSTTTTDTNTAPAAAKVQQLTSATNGTTGQIQVGANTSAASNSVYALINWLPDATIAVRANTDQAMQAIRAVTNGSYTATITVVANVQQATAAIAAVPRQAGARSLPTVTGTAAGSAPVPGPTHVVNYNIKVDAGINDPDSVARSIDRMILQRQRRATTVFAR